MEIQPMKNTRSAAVVVVSTLAFSCLAYAAPLGSGFQYQGRLLQAGVPFTGDADLEFNLYDDESGGTLLGTQTLLDVSVADGLFVVELNENAEFGASAFAGDARWMEVVVEGTPLTPRQKISATPYALHSLSTQGITTDGGGRVRVDMLAIDGGTADSRPVEVWGSSNPDNHNIPFVELVKLDVSYSDVIGIRPNGELFEWTAGIGIGTPPTGTYVEVSANTAKIAIRTDGTLVGWDSNVFGQANVPPGTYTVISAGDRYGLAIRTDGTLAGWGTPTNGQLTLPGGTFVDVAAGDKFAVGIRTDGTLHAWGNSNALGQLNVPAGTFSAVAAGNYYGVAIRADGTLAGWGTHDDLGFHYPVSAMPPGTYTEVDIFFDSLVALRSDGAAVEYRVSDAWTQVQAGPFSDIGHGNINAGVRTSADGFPALLLSEDAAFKPGSSSWSTYSDRRLKKDIAPLDNALDKLLGLQGRTFEWRDPATQGNHYGLQMGLIADEVAQVFPDWIGRGPQGFQTLTINGFEALTIEALREMQRDRDEEIARRDAELAAQREEIAELQARLARLEAALAATAEAEKGAGQ
jgi:hypothetical protein